MTADFSGYATRSNVRCSDGRTIMPDAFKDNDGAKVPLVWQHGHKDINNVLGHAVLENKSDGVYAHGYFNDSQAASNARAAVEHGDVNSLSIYANDLVERNGNVMHGQIREVSLVLAGANPEAKIDNVVIRHSDGFSEELDSDAVITGGVIIHADDTTTGEGEDERTVQDVLDTLTDDQRMAVMYVFGSDEDDDDEDGDDDEEAAESTENNDSNESTDSTGGEASHSINEGAYMNHNVFEKASATGALSHSEIRKAKDELNTIIADASKRQEGTLQESLHHAISNSKVLQHAIGEDTDYGINSLELLFPDAQNINGNKPEAIRRQQEWVNKVLTGVSKRPFSRLKMMHFDMTHEDARARGYIRGNMKKEMFWSMTKRTTEPTTVYQKQKMDRDDLIDITTVDIVAWLWEEMRISLNEEIARAIMFGDGREIDDPDKIQEDKIRPIVTDDPFYAHQVNIPESIYTDGIKLIDTVFRAKKAYKGTGTPLLFAAASTITDLLLLRDPTFDRRHFDSVQALASQMGVAGIVEVDDGILYGSDILGVMVNLADYAVGTDKGGEITTFDDFDIDYNQYKYLLEGRMSGSLIKPKAAVVLRKSSGSELTESSPLINPAPTDEPTRPVGTAYRSTSRNAGMIKGEDGNPVSPSSVDDPSEA